MTGNQWHTLGDIGQWLAVFFLFSGIAIMGHFNVGAGSILFSVGSLVLVISTKCKYYGRRFKDNESADRKRHEIQIVKEGTK